MVSVNIDFGKTEKYIEDRGFGFVSHTFVGRGLSSKVFFHIKMVKKNAPDLVKLLNQYTDDEPLYFWYEFGASEKGQQVISILDSKIIRKNHLDKVSAFIQVIEKNWMNIVDPLPELIRKATYDLLLPDEAAQFAARRQILEDDKNSIRGDVRKIDARLQKMSAHELSEKESEAEFALLVAEMSVLGFTHSHQVSAYIVRHKLGHKYKHISGILQMEMLGEVWNFNGGFPPYIYARLCKHLGLKNKHSLARPLDFTPYKNFF